MSASKEMGRKPYSPGASTEREVVLAVALFALGAWTVAIPYLGHAIGLSVDVAARVEVVDHVLPGTVVMAVGATLFVSGRRTPVLAKWPAIIGGGISFLAGFWVLATHIPLIADAARGSAGWGATLWHASTALPIVVISLWYALRGSPTEPRKA